MKRTKQNYIDLLDETVNYYKSDPSNRAISYSGACMYYMNGKMCAVGRCLIDPKNIEKISSKEKDSSSIKTLLTSNKKIKKLNAKDKLFKPKYTDFNLHFWEDLQDLHDDSNNWTENTLSHEGHLVYDLIKQQILSGQYD